LQTEAACIGKLPEIQKGNPRFIFTAALVLDCGQGIVSILIRSGI
jgi:proline iminopeptidase